MFLQLPFFYGFYNPPLQHSCLYFYIITCIITPWVYLKINYGTVKNYNIKEIARQLNVSISTVSRALSNHPRIGLGTKTRVQQLAKELNYEPNPKAISFKQKKTFVIGVVLPNIREDFFSEAISGIEIAALEHDYTILFGQSYDDQEKEIKVVDAMKRQRVDGLIISLSKQTNTYDHLRALDKYDIPVVYFDRVP